MTKCKELIKQREMYNIEEYETPLDEEYNFEQRSSIIIGIDKSGGKIIKNEIITTLKF